MTNLNDDGAGSLRKAILETPANGTVNFQDGLTGKITLTSGPLMISNLLTIDGPGASVITVTGNKKQQIFNIPAPFTATISGLTIANGSGGTGAGIFDGGALAITDCTLSGNFANGGYGGGIFNAGTLKVTGCTFSGNSAGQGGGIFNQSNATLTVNNSTFSGNHGDLGACIVNNSGTATVTDSNFSGNNSAAAYGAGGIYNEGNSALTVTNSTFTGNSAGSAGGGGILNSGGTLTISSCTFSANSTSGAGGGISDTSSSKVTIASSTFAAANAAVTGAGISHTGGGTLTLTSSTLSGNVASSQGGGIFQMGGGKVVIRNTLLAANSAGTAPNDVMGTLSSQGYNLIGIVAGGTFGATDLVGTVASPIDPHLGPLQDNGGPTFTMALLPGSRALNSGDPAELGQPDQRGVVRTGAVNIGAYQASASAFVVAVPAQASASVPFGVTITAVDSFDQVAIGYTGTVRFTSDPQGAKLPDEYTFTASDNGVHAFNSVTLSTPGTWTITVTDSSGITGNATIIATSSAAVDHFDLIAPPSATAGSLFDVMVKAVDSNGDGVPGYTGTVHFTSTDLYPGVVLPPDYMFTSDDQGMHTFTGGVTLFTAGSQTLTVQDTTTSSIAGNATISVAASAATRLQLMAPPAAIAGTPFDVMVAALDPYGNVDPSYTGAVTLTSSDRYPEPLKYTLSASDSGTHTFTMSLYTAGVQTLSAWDAANASIRGTASIAVGAAPASQFLITPPSTVVAGTPFDAILTALDPYGNTDINYQGTVHFTSSDSDPGARLPADYTFVPADQGVHTFVGQFTLVTMGSQTLTATDMTNAAIAGSASLTVDPGMLPPPGGPGRPGRPVSNPIAESIGTLSTASNQSLDQQIVSLDWLFASVRGKELDVLLGRHREVYSLPGSFEEISDPAV